MKKEAKISNMGGSFRWKDWLSLGPKRFVDNVTYALEHFVKSPTAIIEGYRDNPSSYNAHLNPFLKRVEQFKKDRDKITKGKDIGSFPVEQERAILRQLQPVYELAAQHYKNHLEGLDRLSPKLNEYFTRQISEAASNLRLQAALDRKQLALKLLDWHGGQWSGLYAVGSSWYTGHEVPMEEVQRADMELEKLINKEVNYPETMTDQDIAELMELRKQLNEAAVVQSLEDERGLTASNECGGYRKPKGHLDDQVFEECKGTPTDRDVVKKTRKKKASSMKMVKTASGKTQLKLSKTDWLAIGKQAGWIEKEAKWGKKVEVEQPGKWTNYSKEELIKKRDAARKRQKNRKEKGNKADPKDTELLRELNFAIRAKGDWGKAD